MENVKNTFISDYPLKKSRFKSLTSGAYTFYLGSVLASTRTISRAKIISINRPDSFLTIGHTGRFSRYNLGRIVQAIKDSEVEIVNDRIRRMLCVQ